LGFVALTRNSTFRLKGHRTRWKVQMKVDEVRPGQIETIPPQSFQQLGITHPTGSTPLLPHYVSYKGQYDAN
jgi:hypothetical protein